MITIQSVTRLPYAADEEPGMPSFNVTGTIGQEFFHIITSVEIDGRDAEHDVKEGPEDVVNGEEYFVALCENADFKREFEAASEEYFSIS